MSSIATRTGDDGSTGLASGARILTQEVAQCRQHATEITATDLTGDAKRHDHAVGKPLRARL